MPPLRTDQVTSHIAHITTRDVAPAAIVGIVAGVLIVLIIIGCLIQRMLGRW